MSRSLILAVCVAAGLAAILAAWYGSEAMGNPDAHPEPPEAAEPAGALVLMPTKSSRPGCETDDMCYIPHTIQVASGQVVSWHNADAAFHSVTSGMYGEPDGMFDSGHMDPDDIFSYTFDVPGSYAYHCTLHPWMTGMVVVD